MSSSVKVKEEPDSDASPPRQGAKLVWPLTQSDLIFFSTIKQSVSRMVWAIFFLATFQSQPTRPLKPFANTKNRLVKLVLEDFWVF